MIDRSPDVSGEVACSTLVDTPLGVLTVEVGHRGAARHARSGLVATASGGRRETWSTVASDIELLVTPYEDAVRERDHPVAGSWGVVVSVTAVEPLPPLEVRAFLPDGQRGEPAFGQYLACYDFESPDWALSLGGPADDLFVEQATSGGLPAAWAGQFSDVEETGFGFFQRTPNELCWLFPGLPAGSTVSTHVAVAWTPNRSNALTATWLAVDVASAFLEAASEHGG